jgi:hypothetical protein
MSAPAEKKDVEMIDTATKKEEKKEEPYDPFFGKLSLNLTISRVQEGHGLA